MALKTKSSYLKTTINPQSQTRLFELDQKIQRLRERRSKLQLTQDILFKKEAEKILQEDFSPELALSILDKSWNGASPDQKKEWARYSSSFRFSFSRSVKKSPSCNAALNTSTRAEGDCHELP